MDAETFTHLVPAYQILAGQGNEEAERILNLVHTTQSMQREKDAITSMPPRADDEVDYGTGESADFFGDDGDDSKELMDIGGEACTSSRSGMPSWAFSKDCDIQHFKTTLIHQIQDTHNVFKPQQMLAPRSSYRNISILYNCIKSKAFNTIRMSLLSRMRLIK